MKTLAIVYWNWVYALTGLPEARVMARLIESGRLRLW